VPRVSKWITCIPVLHVLFCHAYATQLLARLRDSREWHLRVGRIGKVVKSNTGDIFGDGHILLAQHA